MDIVREVIADLSTILSINANKITGNLDQDILMLNVRNYYHVNEIRSTHKGIISEYFSKVLYNKIWVTSLVDMTTDGLALQVKLKLKILSPIKTYFDIVPRDVIIVILTKLNLSSMHFRKFYPDISDQEILFNKGSRGFGVVVALNSTEDDMPELEKFFPYLKYHLLTDTDASGTFGRYLFKTLYNSIYVKLTPEIIVLLESGYSTTKIGFSMDKKYFCWEGLISDMTKLDKSVGLKNYTIKVLSKGSVDDDSLSVASLYGFTTGTRDFPVLAIVLNLIRKNYSSWDLRLPDGSDPFDYNLINRD